MVGMIDGCQVLSAGTGGNWVLALNLGGGGEMKRNPAVVASVPGQMAKGKHAKMEFLSDGSIRIGSEGSPYRFTSEFGLEHLAHVALAAHAAVKASDVPA